MAATRLATRGGWQPEEVTSVRLLEHDLATVLFSVATKIPVVVQSFFKDLKEEKSSVTQAGLVKAPNLGLDSLRKIYVCIRPLT